MTVFSSDTITAAVAGGMLAGLLRACVGGGLFVIFLWILCRCCPRLPAAARFSLWWLACAKMLVGFLCAATVNVPVLIPKTAATAPHPAAVHAVLRRFTVAPAKPRAISETESRDAAAAAGAPAATVAAAAASLPASHPRVLRVPLLLAAVWLLGVIVALLVNLRAALALRRLLQNAIPVPFNEDTLRAARAVGLHTPPCLMVSPDAAGLFVTGLWRPVLVLPQGFGEGLTPPEIRMALAHEMTHLKRGDLLLCLLPALVRALFWFFPLAYLACRECAACREEACDAAALAAADAAPVSYAQLLLKMVARQQREGVGRVSAPAGLPMAAVHFRQVKRRLLAIQRTAGRAMRFAGMVCVACGIAGVLPWRVFAVLPKLEEAVNAVENTPLPAYTLTDLGTLGGRYSDAYAINESGSIVGTANVFPLGVRGHAFAYHEGRMRDLTAGSIYRHSVAFAMNEQGQAAAVAFNSRNRPYAFVWDKGKRRYIGSLPGLRYSRALAINEEGAVAGTAQAGGAIDGALPARAFVWQKGQMRGLGTLGGPYSHALAMNSAGHVVGKADLPRGAGQQNTPTHAFLYDGATMRDLGTLPGGQNSLACDINTRGQVVGFSETGSGTVPHAFLYENGALRDLGVLDGTDGSVAYSISDTGEAAVGASFVGGPGAGGERRAVLWLPGRNGSLAPRPLDLNTVLPPDSGWTLESARGINRRGQIVGQGRINGQHRAFLLTPR